MTHEQELEMLREELRRAGGVLPEPRSEEAEPVAERPRMEDIHSHMSDEDRARTLKHILSVLRGEE